MNSSRIVLGQAFITTPRRTTMKKSFKIGDILLAKNDSSLSGKFCVLGFCYGGNVARLGSLTTTAIYDCLKEDHDNFKFIEGINTKNLHDLIKKIGVLYALIIRQNDLPRGFLGTMGVEPLQPVQEWLNERRELDQKLRTKVKRALKV